MSQVGIQKLVFLDGAAESVTSVVRPYWEAASTGYAHVVQHARIVPMGTSKGSGVSVLLNERGGISVGSRGKNDVEMLKLAGLGVALSNGCKEAKAVANVIGLTNDDDGVTSSAIYTYALGSKGRMDRWVHFNL